jgi:hypothetical protein
MTEPAVDPKLALVGQFERARDKVRQDLAAAGVNTQVTAAMDRQQQKAERERREIELPEGSETITAESTREDVLALAAKLHADKAAQPLHATRAQFKEGARFRVVKEGARLEALVYFGETTWSGWSRPLEVGEVITCTGWQDGFGDGYTPITNTGAGNEAMVGETIKPQVANFTGDDVPREARWVAVWPLAGLWKPYPAEGYLEPLSDNEED